VEATHTTGAQVRQASTWNIHWNASISTRSASRERRSLSVL
jgi:hypothetical protein